jgi:hypothetical protein
MISASQTHEDHFNWPTLARKDLMSMTGLSKVTDGFETRTLHFRPKSRTVSTNLMTQDISGKLQ